MPNSAPEAAAAAPAAKEAAFRFTPGQDISFLKEIAKHKPFAVGHGQVAAAWDDVAAGVRRAEGLPEKRLAGIAAKRRWEKLLKAFKSEEMAAL
ncbi:hypothetical protein HK101_009762 [Irineochytrium annulatum]|nr:hypothetical protein HK101_009762 [Irineochytrium annulatum]